MVEQLDVTAAKIFNKEMDHVDGGNSICVEFFLL